MKEGLEVIERNCRMQAQLIEDVLDVSRIVSGNMELQTGPCELADVINAAIDVVRPAAEAKTIGFDINLDPAASRASCDARRMEQVVWNLLANAVKFSPSGRLIRISLSRFRSTARIEIGDDGQGISAQFLPHVFDRFRQAESSTRRKHGGLGLGLSIVKHIVELHGGTVQASSAGEGRGATFTVNLPVRAVHVVGPTPRSEFSDPPQLELLSVRLDGVRVLAVDDEADARRLLSKVLGEAGANITAVGSVTEAMAAIGAGCPDVLLSDIAMPDQDGYDLIGKVRSAGHSVKVLPAVALTAFAHKDDRLRALLAGFQVHVPKPIDPHELVAVIATLAGRTGEQSV
jgi:CheY-like chemotaxis protein